MATVSHTLHLSPFELTYTWSENEKTWKTRVTSTVPRVGSPRPRRTCTKSKGEWKTIGPRRTAEVIYHIREVEFARDLNGRLFAIVTHKPLSIYCQHGPLPVLQNV